MNAGLHARRGCVAPFVHSPGNRLQLRLCSTQVCAGGKPSEDSNLWAFSSLDGCGIEAQRRPERAGSRESKTARHDADDGAKPIAKTHGTSNGQWIGVETGLPEVFSNHYDGLRGRLFVVVKKRPAVQRRGGDHTKC